MFQYTFADYALVNSRNALEPVRLTGASAEYVYHGAAPVSIVGRFAYGGGSVLGQRLFVIESGVGLHSVFGRFVPFGEVLAGLAHTRSNDFQYLYPGARVGLAIAAVAGLDYHSDGHWGVRLVQVQADHYSFGVQGKDSLYWTFGTGVVFSFRRSTARD